MKTQSLPLALGSAALLTASLFSYSRTETINRTTSRFNIDGAGLASIVLCIVLFVLCRRMAHTLTVALRNAGLPSQIRIPTAFRIVILAAIPFFVFGSSESTTDHGITRTFAFGMSPLKLPVFVLTVFLAWLVGFVQQFRALLSQLPTHSNATGNG